MANSGRSYKVTIEPVSSGAMAETNSCRFGDGNWDAVAGSPRVFVIKQENNAGPDASSAEDVVSIIQGTIVSHNADQDITAIVSAVAGIAT